jgi:hypothetical protein
MGKGSTGIGWKVVLLTGLTFTRAKYYNYKFFQRLRPTLDIDLLVRLTKDHSSPLLPSDNKIGLGPDFLLSNLDQLKKKKANLVWATFQLHHYSNGQTDSFFIESHYLLRLDVVV